MDTPASEGARRPAEVTWEMTAYFWYEDIVKTRAEVIWDILVFGHLVSWIKFAALLKIQYLLNGKKQGLFLDWKAFKIVMQCEMYNDFQRGGFLKEI